MGKDELVEQRAGRLLFELREATQEAAGVLKDLTRAMKEARAQVETFAVDEIGRQLGSLAQQALDMLKAQNDEFIDKWRDAKKEACDEAKAHMEDDWRLAVTVNTVGNYVFQALTEAYQHPIDCGCDMDGIPKKVSPEFIADTTFEHNHD